MIRNSASQPNKNHPNKEKGMTFIEVLIALVIMVTGILGAVAMQATAKKGSFDAMQRSLASSLAQDIIERMRSNDATQLAQYRGYDYGVTLGTAVATCSTAAGCSSANMATNDLYEWELSLMGANVKKATSNAGGLINARACIAVSDNSATVAITWQGRTEMKDNRSTIDTGTDVDGNATTGACGGSADDKRRQVLVEAFIY